jgi:hypothetical protein
VCASFCTEFSSTSIFFLLINLKLALSIVGYPCSILNLQQYLTVSDFLISENLVYSVAKSLPQEIDKTHQQRWDAVIASQYLRDLREATGGRIHLLLLQFLLTVCIPYNSKNMIFQNSLKLDALSGRTGPCSQPMPRAKETLSRVAVTRASS